MAKASKRQDLIPHTYNGFTFYQRKSDGYYDATQMCAIFGKKFNAYYRTKGTKKFLESLSRSAKIHAHALIEINTDNKNEDRGTFVHPLVANHLAFTLDADFAVFVSLLIEAHKQGKLQYRPAIDKTSQERLDTTPYTKTLRDAIHQKINEADKWIYLNVENAVHKAITGMSATHHKKQAQHNNGVDLLCKREKEVFNIIKELFYIELGKYANNSLSGEDIRKICDDACIYGEQLIAMHEGRGLMDAHRHTQILPISVKKQKTLT